MTLTDENAFGVLIVLYDISDREYGAEPQEFVEDFTRFRRELLAEAAARPLGNSATVIDLGHAIYFEICDGDHEADPISWARGVCGPLLSADYELSAVVTHGGRWADPSAGDAVLQPVQADGYRLLQVSHPSEPLQRALYASAFCHASDGPDGWGTGLFVDTDAIEALGKQLRNKPTPLEAAGATFYRLTLAR